MCWQTIVEAQSSESQYWHRKMVAVSDRCVPQFAVMNANTEKQPSAPDLLTIEEVAERARKSVSTMRHLRAKGLRPRAGRLGRRLVYSRAEVDAWIAAAFEAGEAK